MNGRYLIIAILLFFWLFIAYRAYTRGDMAMAGVYALVGCALSVWRFQRTKG